MHNSKAIYYLMPLLGVLLLSPDTLLLRSMPFSLDGILAVRGFISMLVILIYLIIRYRLDYYKRIRMIGWTGLGAGILLGISNYGFIYAVQTTTIADLLVILAILPIASSVLAAIFLKEKPSPALWIASTGCFLGILILFSGEVNYTALLGNISAVITTILMAAAMVMLRAKPNIDMTPTFFVSGALVFAITIHDAELAAHMGLEYWPLYIAYSLVMSSFILILLSMRYLPAPEVSLFILLETILGPLWVWMFIGEIPRVQTVVGGALILSILIIYFGYLIFSLRVKRLLPQNNHPH